MAKCRFCKKTDAPLRLGLSNFCDMECAYAFTSNQAVKAKKKREKAERKHRNDQLAVLNQTVKHWRPKAQSAFNRFIRLRDHHQPCISCGRTEMEISSNYSGTGGMWDAGHYLSCGSTPELRFSEDNCHKQCKNCNRDKSGNAGKYRVNLVERIGQHRVDILEGPHEIPKWKWYDYKAVYDWYQKLANKMEKEIGV